VLAVDDEFGISTLLEDVLEDEGHHALLATNGQQALAAGRRYRPPSRSITGSSRVSATQI
jgi:DNA-binding response OmpR family regulator